MTNLDYQRAADRPTLVALLRKQFPHLPADDTALSPTLGGRVAALALLEAVEPEVYEHSHNFLAGKVTHLSAYLRHGVLTLAEVRDAALRKAKRPEEATKLINELAWRDYFQRLYAQMGEGVWQDREPSRTGFAPAVYAPELPAEIPAASTTLRCMDGFARQLTETGYLHNHARLWFSAYIVHWRRVSWQAGARWFLEHLIDGDPASNNLSWQWVASTFSGKPYVFNRENLQRYTDNAYCRECPHATAGTCPFDREYETLEQALFPRLNAPTDASVLPPPPRPFVHPAAPARAAHVSGNPLLWIHTDSVNPESPMLRAHPDAPAVFVWDLSWLRESQIALKRLMFLAECLVEMQRTLQIRVGDPAAELLASARQSGADYILAQHTPDPRLRAAAEAASSVCPVIWYDPPVFAEAGRALDLKRFSRYWQKAKASALHPTGASGAFAVD